MGGKGDMKEIRPIPVLLERETSDLRKGRRERTEGGSYPRISKKRGEREEKFAVPRLSLIGP